MLKVSGKFIAEHWRNGKKINEYEFKNGVTDEGINKLLDVMFHGVAAIATWYIGLIDDYGYSALAAADTMSSHAGWAECTEYDEAARQEWVEDAASGLSITNTTLATFTINATTTLKGMFLSSGSAKSGTTGTLWCTGLFASGDVSVVDDDVIKVKYTVTIGAA